MTADRNMLTVIVPTFGVALLLLRKTRQKKCLLDVQDYRYIRPMELSSSNSMKQLSLHWPRM